MLIRPRMKWFQPISDCDATILLIESDVCSVSVECKDSESRVGSFSYSVRRFSMILFLSCGGVCHFWSNFVTVAIRFFYFYFFLHDKKWSCGVSLFMTNLQFGHMCSKWKFIFPEASLWCMNFLIPILLLNACLFKLNDISFHAIL